MYKSGRFKYAHRYQRYLGKKHRNPTVKWMLDVQYQKKTAAI
jgi:hypothetical protein